MGRCRCSELRGQLLVTAPGKNGPDALVLMAPNGKMAQLGDSVWYPRATFGRAIWGIEDEGYHEYTPEAGVRDLALPLSHLARVHQESIVPGRGPLIYGWGGRPPGQVILQDGQIVGQIEDSALEPQTILAVEDQALASYLRRRLTAALAPLLPAALLRYLGRAI